MSPDEDAEFCEAIHWRMVAYIGERTGLGADVIAVVLEAQAQFWRERPALMARMLSEDEEEPGG